MQAKTLSQGSLLGSILLISGCCTGAGMLGLPVMSALAGFEPSLFMFFISWLFMATTGLLLLEVNLWFRDEVSIISMADRTLGFWGKAVGWGGFLFLFYALMVAYVAGTGSLVTEFLSDAFAVQSSDWMGSLFFVVFFGILIYYGTAPVDQCNRVLMLGLIATYVLLVALGLPHIKLEYLRHSDWKASTLVLPAMIISFGYHNLVPSLTNYLGRDLKRLRLSILIGSALPLLVYIVWQAVILGLIPVEGETGFREAKNQGCMATQALRLAVGQPWIVEVAEYFAFFAIITSYIGVALSFVDFLMDGLHVKKTAQGRFSMCILAFAPPFIMALLYPKIFLNALNYAGAFGAVLLFGILPAAMVWSGRYRKQIEGVRIVPGGKLMLVTVIVFAVAVMLLQLYEEIA